MCFGVGMSTFYLKVIIIIIIGQDPSVSKSNRLHVNHLSVFLYWGYFPWISSNWRVIFLKSWTLTGYFTNSTNTSIADGWGETTIHSFLGGMGLGIRQGTSVWVGMPKSMAAGFSMFLEPQPLVDSAWEQVPCLPYHPCTHNGCEPKMDTN